MGLSRDTALCLRADCTGLCKMYFTNRRAPCNIEKQGYLSGGTTSSAAGLGKRCVRAALIDAVIKSAQKADLMGNEISEFREGDIS